MEVKLKLFSVEIIRDRLDRLDRHILCIYGYIYIYVYMSCVHTHTHTKEREQERTKYDHIMRRYFMFRSQGYIARQYLCLR